VLQLVALHFVGALAAPVLVRWWGRRAFLALAAVPGAAAVWALALTPAVLDGDPAALPHQAVPWVPSLGLALDVRLDSLSWLMVLLVGGIGALVLLYCSAYFSPGSAALGRFAGVFVAFAGAMLAIVTTDNVLALYIAWELTTVFSYLLIGHYFDRKASRRAAMQAIVVTTLGGLAMLAGLVVLAETGGTYTISALVAAPPTGALAEVAVALVLLGAVTKSALVPFHFWLPAAMAAPTPVSAYLHAAAMVKAGVYLVARLAPGFAGAAVWPWVVLGLGSLTLLLGGYRSLRQHDLKLLLAFGTVSQLGLLVVLVGQGSRAVALAGLALLGAHAMFKAALFLVVGIVDDATGTRDLRELSGLARRLPLLAATAALATASMIGLPPLAGYVAKEAALAGLWEGGGGTDLALFAVVVVGSILTVAYGLRFWWGAFADKPGVEPQRPDRPAVLLLGPAAALALGGLVAGLLPGLGEALLAPYADTYPEGEPGHLVLWAGWGAPVAATILVLAAGTVLFLARQSAEALQARVRLGAFDADLAYRRNMRRIDRLAGAVTAGTQRGSLPFYLAVVLVTVVVLAGGAAIRAGILPTDVRAWDAPVQLLPAAIVAVAALLTVRARRRLKAVLLAGVVGYGVALLYAVHGAPDLALTQVLVETVTLVVFVLVLRRLPAYFSNRPFGGDRWWRVALGVAVGVTAAGLALVAPAVRVHTRVSVDFPEEAYVYGYGKNIVNVTLVDIRAWDTMGEISVLLVAATGVASLVFLRSRMRRIERARDLAPEDRATVWAGGGPDPGAALRDPRAGAEAPRADRGRDWLSAGASLAPRRRSVILEVVTRLVFHTMLLFAVFLLFSGHNAPGGGFAAGLVAGIALTLRYLAGGRYELGEAAPVQPGALLGTGLFLSVGAGLLPLALGGDMLQSALVEATLGPLGDVKFVTTLFFDIGVFLVVVGLVLDVLRTLGAEVDRQGEVEGRAVPDVAYDAPVVTADDTGPVAAVAGPGPAPGGTTR
jgi:multicomponent Na+:H+ antiporter subunit A